MILLLVVLIVATASAQEEIVANGVVTNRYIVSQSVEKRAWKRTALMATQDNRLMDPSGLFARYSDFARVETLTDSAIRISRAAHCGMTNAIQSLTVVTNQIPEGAQHIAITLPRLGSPNLQGLVLSEGFDGVNDWQVIRFNQLLSSPPSRVIRYTSPGWSATVEATWDYPWSSTSTDHRCTFPRPAISGGYTIRTHTQEIFGGDQGLSFGAALVTVDGIPTFTGAVTNGVTGEVINFENGVLK